ncbi:UNVERIFIED_CONTAM: putative mitochondrial protein [Sesamum radiatum]|uniref:Mitochondrial protein n=1 Tax=Sesamum radiatum TaxID=300843 RepID=A0AAW2VNG4_SESRA
MQCGNANYYKCIANRLKPLLDKIISPIQSAFIPGRFITNNVLIAFEINHFLKNKNWGKLGHMTLKLDISKAYDKVEWSFLRQVLLKLGFHDHFVQLILLCVSSVSYSFVLNGRQFGNIIPERGLRQGDPLSPYLFLLCTEAFSSLITRTELTGQLKGIRVSRGAPSISHLFFADDTLLCCQATIDSMECIKNILHVYGKASGQEINFHKSVVVFSKNTSDTLMTTIAEGLGIRRADKHDKYLGLPSIVGRSKKIVFDSIRDRIWRKVSSWSEKQLSQAGREVLIKAVVQAIPMYSMSVFRIPDGLLHEIESMIAKFWWNSVENRRIYWLSWDQLCTSKFRGGLGLRDLRAFNSAMLAKQFWRLLVYPKSLVGQVLRARYYPGLSILKAEPGSRPSFTWRSILSSKALIRAGYRWRIGDGRTSRIWIDPWIPRLPSFRPQSVPNSLPPPTTVCHLFDYDSSDWNEPLISSIFDHNDCAAILSLPLTRAHLPVEIVWHFTRSGSFSFKSAYHLAFSQNRLNIPQSSSMNSPTLKKGWQGTWNAKVPNKVRVFAWRLGTNSLPLGPNLSRRIPGIDVLCPLCQAPEEIDKHTFLLCPFARMVWAFSDLRWDVISAWPSNARDWIFSVNQKLDKTDFNLFLVICWAIWWCRNQRWAQNEVVSPEQTIAFARNYLCAFSAMFRETSDIGIGVIARDSQGQCLAWTALRLHKNISPATAEAWAARIAIQFAARHGWPNIVLEVDCAPLHVQLVTFSDRLSNIGPIVHDILALSSSFSHCSFSLVRRSANEVAHTLARNAVSNEEGTNILPIHSCNLVLTDLPS